MKCWSVGKMEAWKENTSFAYLDEGSQQYKLFCFAMVLIIQTIITDRNILGDAWFLVEVQMLQNEKHPYLNEIWQMSTLLLSTPLETNMQVFMR